MKSHLPIAVVIAGAVAGAWSWTLRAQDATTSVWDGVYSTAQATRGQGLYNSSCAPCHGDQLEGAETAPPLSGSEFLSTWNGLTVGQLFERIRASMPPGAPGKVAQDSKVNIVAYILSSNKFPASDKELPRQAEVMKTIRIDAEKPKK